MSYSNPFMRELFFKSMPHPDRKSGEVVTRKMTPEEMQKYGVATKKPEDNKKTEEVVNDMSIREEIMNRVNKGQDINQVVEELVAAGMDKRIVCRYAAEFGYQSAKKAKKITKLAVAVGQPEEVQETDKSELEPELIEQPAKKHNRLKPKGLISQDTGFEYDLFAEELVVTDPSGEDGKRRMGIPWAILKEVREIGGDQNGRV